MKFYKELFIPFIENYFKENDFLKEKDVIYKRYQIEGEKYTCKQIGEIYNISGERVRQIEITTLKKIKSLITGNKLSKINMKVDNSLIEYIEKMTNFFCQKKFCSINEFYYEYYQNNTEIQKKYFFWERFFFKLIGIEEMSIPKTNIKILFLKDKSKNKLENDVNYIYKFMKSNPKFYEINQLTKIIKEEKKINNPEYIKVIINCFPLQKKKINNIDYYAIQIDDTFSAANLAYRLLWTNNKPLSSKEIEKSINEKLLKLNSKKLKERRNICNQMGSDERFVSIGNNKWALTEWNMNNKYIKELIKELFMLENKPLSKSEIIDSIKKIRDDAKENTIISYLNSDDYCHLLDDRIILKKWKNKFSNIISKKRKRTNHTELFIETFNYYKKRILTTEEIWKYVKLKFSNRKYNFKKSLENKSEFISYKKINDEEYWILDKNYENKVKQSYGNKTNYVKSLAIEILEKNKGEMKLTQLKSIILTKVNCCERIVHLALNDEFVFSKIKFSKKCIIKLVKKKKKAKLNLINITEQKLIKLLSLKESNQKLYYFNQGFMNLSAKRNFDLKNFEEIVKTICAMSNHGKKKIGRIFIGITDDNEVSEKIEKLDKIKVEKFDKLNINITGLEREASYMGCSLEEYQNFILEKINNSLIDEKLKIHIRRNIKFIKFKGKYILVLELKSIDGPSFYNKELFIQKKSGLHKVTPITAEFHDVYRRCFI